jgi:hypothetical protein
MQKYENKSKNAGDTEEENFDDTSCLYCLGAFREMWIQCTEFKLRSHE